VAVSFFFFILVGFVYNFAGEIHRKEKRIQEPGCSLQEAVCSRQGQVAVASLQSAAGSQHSQQFYKYSINIIVLFYKTNKKGFFIIEKGCHLSR
jgi:hypothetical protein